MQGSEGRESGAHCLQVVGLPVPTPPPKSRATAPAPEKCKAQCTYVNSRKHQVTWNKSNGSWRVWDVSAEKARRQQVTDQCHHLCSPSLLVARTGEEKARGGTAHFRLGLFIKTKGPMQGQTGSGLSPWTLDEQHTKQRTDLSAMKLGHLPSGDRGRKVIFERPL